MYAISFNSIMCCYVFLSIKALLNTDTTIYLLPPRYWKDSVMKRAMARVMKRKAELHNYSPNSTERINNPFSGFIFSGENGTN